MHYYPPSPRSPRKAVSFDAQPIYSRQPRDDETFVVRAFAKHASHCPSCSDPYATFKDGYTLCAKGHARALDLVQYFFYQDGHIYSLVDREGKQRVQVELPSKYVAAQSLLKAVARGLRLKKAAPLPPVVHYDDYHRPATPQRDSDYYYASRYSYDTPSSSYYASSARPGSSGSATKSYYAPPLSYSARPATYQYAAPSSSYGYYYR